MNGAGPMRVIVDPDKCQGHARCVAIAPNLFVLDDYGNAEAVGGGLVPPAEEDAASRARANCPEMAIHLIEG